MKGEAISDHYLVLWFQKDCWKLSGYGRFQDFRRGVESPADKKSDKKFLNVSRGGGKFYIGDGIS